MRWLLTAALLSALQAAYYPPPFPRVGATKLFDNERVQVWNVAWPKNQPTPLHRHLYDMTGVYYAPGDRLITAVDGTKRPVTTKAWDIVWQQKGVTHTEEGTSDEPLRAVMIELKKDATFLTDTESDGTPQFPPEGAVQRIDNARVRVWEYLKASDAAPRSDGRHAGSTERPHTHLHDTVIVSMDGQIPHALFVTRGTAHTDEGLGAASRAYIFEIK